MTILAVPVTASNQPEWTRRAAGAINQLIGAVGSISAGAVADGDYGDIVVSGTGTVWSFDSGVVTAFAKTFLDDANAGAVRTTIGAAATSHTHTQADLTGLTTADSPQFTAINLGHASDTTLTRVSAGVMAVEGVTILTTATGQPLDADLTALAANSTDGLWAHTGAGTGSARTLTAPAAGLTISNPAGIAGNPTFALANDLSALEALSGTNTLYYRSAADTWTAVTISNDLLFSGGTLGRNRGTSFPGSPATDDIFYRSDRRIEYFYDGTRWLSTTLYSLPIAMNAQDLPFNATNGAFNRNANPHAGAYDVYVIDVILSYVLVGVGNWTIVTSDSIGTLATNSGLTATSQTVATTSVNSVRSNSTCKLFYFTVTENSGTADFYPAVAITYRLVG